ncbi:MAG: 3-phosphoglycerate dehydrogenase [Lachnospiraceae bacterium]|jgi:phosphoglycerate dehydrogenase|nr:MAG: 3-phosphoglycerate dehydrogenase [Lachnospiraceae bacterium]
MKKIHCLNSISKVGLDSFSEDYTFTDNISEADALLVRSASLHDTEFSGDLVAIARAGAGVNNIPVDRCSEEGIVVFNTPGANANSVKELVIAAMLIVARDVIGGIEWVKSVMDNPNIAKEVEKAKSRFAGHEIKNKKLGVIGLGAIGSEVANAASSLGMEVYGYDPYMTVNAAFRLSRRVHPVTDIHKIYENCDYISLHMPLTDENTGMINEESLSLMKDEVVILNFSRDKLVNDEDMAKALKSGKVKRYVTDFPNEHIRDMEGVLAIPHLGASTEESEDNCALMAAEELMDYIENGNITNSVNFPNCDMGICRVTLRVALLHSNKPNMIGQISAVLAAKDINISDLTNKSKGKYAYTLVDLDSELDEDAEAALKKIDGMKRVRRIYA